jgi:hypothetical protein
MSLEREGMTSGFAHNHHKDFNTSCLLGTNTTSNLQIFIEIKMSVAVMCWISQYIQIALGWNPTRRIVQRAKYSYDVNTWLHSTPSKALKL